MKINLRNMRSPKGNDVPNQFIIGSADGQYFQSYKTVIAHKDNNGNVFLDKKAWDYSRTTSRYRNQFLGETTEQCKYQIEIGNYKLVDLNKKR